MAKKGSKFVYRGTDLKRIRDLEKALNAVAAMDVRAVTHNTDGKFPQKLLFASSSIKGQITGLINRCLSARLQVFVAADNMAAEEE